MILVWAAWLAGVCSALPAGAWTPVSFHLDSVPLREGEPFELPFEVSISSNTTVSWQDLIEEGQPYKGDLYAVHQVRSPSRRCDD